MGFWARGYSQSVQVGWGWGGGWGGRGYGQSAELMGGCWGRRVEAGVGDELAA